MADSIETPPGPASNPRGPGGRFAPRGGAGSTATAPDGYRVAEGANRETASGDTSRGHSEPQGGNGGFENRAGNSEGAADPKGAAGPQAKKRRGRPPGSANRPKPEADPGPSLGASQGGGPGPDLKKGKARRVPGEPSVKASELAVQVQASYEMLAVFTSEPAFIIGREKSLAIALAVEDLSRWYNLSYESPMLSTVKLIGALAIVNLPIMLTIAAKREAARAARATQPGTSAEFEFRPAEGPDGKPKTYKFQ